MSNYARNSYSWQLKTLNSTSNHLKLYKKGKKNWKKSYSDFFCFQFHRSNFYDENRMRSKSKHQVDKKKNIEFRCLAYNSTSTVHGLYTCGFIIINFSVWHPHYECTIIANNVWNSCIIFPLLCARTFSNFKNCKTAKLSLDLKSYSWTLRRKNYFSRANQMAIILFFLYRSRVYDFNNH